MSNLPPPTTPEGVARKAMWDELYQDGFIGSITDIANAMAIPFWWHREAQPHSQILHNGTLCIVDTGSRVIGVTADHVYRAYLQERGDEPDIVCQFGDLTVFPEHRPIDRSQRLDLATFDLPEFMGSERRFLSQHQLKWPPKRLAKGQPVIYGGYPGSTRFHGEPGKVVFAFESITGFVSDVSAASIALHVGYENLYWPGQPEGEEVNTNPGGVSGGPVYYLYEMEGTQTWYLELVGFIYEFAFETMLARHADAIRADGTILR